MKKKNLKAALAAYLECALWSSVDPETDEPLDNGYSILDVSEEFSKQAIEDIACFIWCNRALVREYLYKGMSYDQLGYDFWLTRNGHGAGFWDRGLGELGEELTKACKSFGSVDLYAHDGLVYSN